MFTDSRLEEISAAESQPVANRLLSELILELRRHRAAFNTFTQTYEVNVAKGVTVNAEQLQEMLRRSLDNPQRGTGYLKDKSEKRAIRK